MGRGHAGMVGVVFNLFTRDRPFRSQREQARPRAVMAKSASNVKQLRNDDEVQKEMALSGDKLVVVKFFAQW